MSLLSLFRSRIRSESCRIGSREAIVGKEDNITKSSPSSALIRRYSRASPRRVRARLSALTMF